jgi:hypothetical protein
MIHVCKDGNPTYAGGQLNLNGAMEIDRAQSLHVRLGFTREMTGTQLHALQIEVVRDVAQGTDADKLAYKTMFGADGRAQKTLFPLRVLFVDDVRKGQPALIGTLICEQAIVAGIRRLGGRQVITFLASHWKYANAITPQDDPTDPNLVPVKVTGFVRQED